MAPGPDAEVRPWGHFEVLRETASYKLKLLVVQPGQRLSLQRHHHRAEHWHVVQGTAQVTLGDSALVLATGASIDIPALAWHRLANSGDEALVLIEVQRGRYFGEDDIERRSDDHGRAG